MAVSEIKRYVPGFLWHMVGRTVVFKEEGVEQKDIISSLVLENQLIVLSTLLISAASLPFLFFYFAHGLDFKLIPLIFLVILLAVFCFIFQKNIFKNGFKKLLEHDISQYLFSPFTSKQNFLLFSYAFITFLSMGIGAYFSILAFIPLSPAIFTQLVGLFIFSYLVGYVSFIFPTGLGIREGIITLALSKISSVTLAGFAAILFRLVFVICEFLFLLGMFVIHKSKSEVLDKWILFIASHKQETAAFLLTGIFIIYFSCVGSLRYENFFTGRFDLGNADQVVWNTSRGRIFQLTDPNGTNIISRLSTHADFLLIFLAPLYRIWADPRILIILQVFVAGLGAIFIFKISEYVLKNKNIAVAFVFAYLVNPSLGQSILYDFHAVVLATTFLLGAFYFALKQKFFPFLLFCILAGLCKEEVWIITGLLSIFYLYHNHKKTKGWNKYAIAAFSIISFLAFYYLVWWAIPSVRKSQHFALSYYSDFGTSPTQVVKNIILSPLKTLGTVFSPEKLLYLLQIFVPLGFLSILGLPFLLFAIPDLGINLLSNNTQLVQIAYQYTASITPFVFISAIYGVYLLQKRFKTSSFSIILYLLFFAILGAYAIGPLPGAYSPNIDMFIKPQPNKDVIDAFLSQMPKRFSVAATNNLGSHLSRRQRIYTIPQGVDKADVVLFLLNDIFAQPSLNAQAQMAQDLSHNKNYIEVFKLGDFVAFEKKAVYFQSQPQPGNRKPAPLPVSIPLLQKRDYGTAQLNIGPVVSKTKTYTASIVTYESDGLSLHTLYTLPNSPKPPKGYPVIILNHGYISPRTYDSVNSYFGITDFFAKSGFIVLKPDYRGNAQSEGASDPTLRRFEYPIDVMNLIASVQNIPNADSSNIFIWGHSMGGEITLKSLEIIGKKQDLAKRVKAAVVWAPVSDTIAWFTKDHAPTLPEYSSGSENLNNLYKILGNPTATSATWQSLSPLTYLSDIQTPVAIFHGTGDQTVPNGTSIALYNDLKSLNKQATLTLFPNDNHNLSTNFTDAATQSLDFFKKYLSKL